MVESRGISYHNLKASNVFISRKGEVRLASFGQRLQPEVLTEKNPDCQDVGHLTYHILTGIPRICGGESHTPGKMVIRTKSGNIEVSINHELTTCFFDFIECCINKQSSLSSILKVRLLPNRSPNSMLTGDSTDSSKRMNHTTWPGSCTTQNDCRSNHAKKRQINQQYTTKAEQVIGLATLEDTATITLHLTFITPGGCITLLRKYSTGTMVLGASRRNWLQLGDSVRRCAPAPWHGTYDSEIRTSTSLPAARAAFSVLQIRS
ncbi:hypothetical protein G7Y89_g10776 [Cudoniella acicularis]|uniref:Protein kinase domain-containing protein n=1 Tax=Cudoniella acicularis TaxID=354080 RepID=A0A8H4W194_9HELO|nr:hypothetical protein G7Y89_g10776 [Cudoniella acicularis]